MKNQLLTLVAAVACSFAIIGCSTTEAPATDTKPAETGSTATAEKATCTDCGHEMDKSAMKEVDGKMVCVNCAEKGEGMQTADMIDCPCGKQIAAADAVEKDGKKVCADCAKM
ncbi:hypothetical protein CCB80_10365 [Armatimonadetes bacterium Uphvl-Ar1]|nr:hypothetical protein CCB80_10365 [Armatimonadetes bacterium Uphvl-Ar1]